MKSFSNARIALLEARMSSELADMIRRYGGEPYSVPAVREVPVDAREDVSAFIDKLNRSAVSVVVFFTGVGVKGLIQEAERLERLPELLDALRHVTVVSRGHKPAAVLKRYKIPIAVNTSEPYTTNDLLDALATLDLVGVGVGVVHYGERNVQLTETLVDRGAHVEELCVYEWLMPEDIGPLQTLIQEIIDERVDAVVFTSQIQARHLFRIAADLQATDKLTRALNTSTIVASVGPTCTAALRDLGVTPHVEPEHPKSGHLIKALADYMK